MFIFVAVAAAGGVVVLLVDKDVVMAFRCTQQDSSLHIVFVLLLFPKIPAYTGLLFGWFDVHGCHSVTSFGHNTLFRYRHFIQLQVMMWMLCTISSESWKASLLGPGAEQISLPFFCFC